MQSSSIRNSSSSPNKPTPTSPAISSIARRSASSSPRRAALSPAAANATMSDTDIIRLRQFAEARSFDLAYYPGMQRAEADRFNILGEPYFFDGAMALIGPDREGFLDRYKFDLSPATDERPYFFDFFK